MMSSKGTDTSIAIYLYLLHIICICTKCLYLLHNITIRLHLTYWMKKKRKDFYFQYL